MKLVATGAALLLVTGALVWFLADREPATKIDGASAGDQLATETSTTELSSAEQAGSSVEPSEVTALRQRIANLTIELEQLAARRDSAEAKLQQAELDVTELERFIEEIEERGEDPVDYADEGLAMYQPAFNAYQDAVDELASTEVMRQTLADDLAAAELELESELLEQDNKY